METTASWAFVRDGRLVVEGAGLRFELPVETPPETVRTLRRLVDLTDVLATKCAQLQEALDSRVVIEQAKGVLAERFTIPPDEAFQILRRAARRNRMSIHLLAAAVVASRDTPDELRATVPDSAA